MWIHKSKPNTENYTQHVIIEIRVAGGFQINFHISQYRTTIERVRSKNIARKK